MQTHRVKFSTEAELPAPQAPEGYKAAYWRERVMGLSRPELARLLNLGTATIGRYEKSATVPEVYRLACTALAAQQGKPTW